jgi:hypothetical protein
MGSAAHSNRNEARVTSSSRSVPARVGLATFAVLLPVCAFAELGGTVRTIEQDRIRMQATVNVRQARRYAVHELTSESGSTVREFVAPDGNIFAVAWEGPFHPDYRQLLGRYFDRLPQSTEVRRARRAPITIDTSAFVFQSFGHFRALAGRAYLPGMVPPGVAMEEIR